MSMRLLLTAILFISALGAANLDAQGNWQQILPPGATTNQMTGLFFMDAHTGWSVGDYGTIQKTSDGGITWRIIPIPWLTPLRDVFFVSGKTGFIVGQNGLILKSGDGGEKWEQKIIRYTNNLNRVIFSDSLHGWIVGEKGLILHSSDGGENWLQQISNSREELKGIARINDSSFCITGKNRTWLLSRNSGASWGNLSPELLNAKYNYHFNDVFFLDEQKGWIGGSKIISDYLTSPVLLHTPDGGNSWLEIQIINTNYEDLSIKSGSSTSIEQLCFDGFGHGLFTQSAGYNAAGSPMPNGPYYTKDNGKNWKCILSSHYEVMAQNGRFFFVTPNKVIKNASRGEFMISLDGGQSWEFPNAAQRGFDGLRFAGNGILLTSKIDQIQKNRIWLRSSDYGRTWQNLEPEFRDSGGAMIYPDLHARPGFPIGELLWEYFETPPSNFYYMYESIDRGQTWHQLYGPITAFPPWRLYFLTPDTVISYTLEIKTSGSVQVVTFVYYFSSNGARSFQKIEISGLWNQLSPFDASNPMINSHFFIDNRIGLVIGSDGNILKTMDAGLSWKSIYSGVADDLWGIHFISADTGFVTGEFGRILKSTDGGETWRKTNSGTQETIYAVAFKNQREGWAGYENGLLFTNDAGETWQPVPLRYQHGPIRHLYFDAQGTGYASLHYYFEEEEGPGTRMIKPQSPPWDYEYLLVLPGDDTGVEKNQYAQFPQQPVLQQNYPNPFNASTTISFYLPKSGEVTIDVYNIYGQLVRHLLHEIKSSGHHSQIWDGRSPSDEMAPSGVYVYRLQMAGSVQTKKMILVR